MAKKIEIPKEKLKFVVMALYPALPTRRYDWVAFIDGFEEEGPKGFGASAIRAIEDLMIQSDEWCDR